MENKNPQESPKIHRKNRQRRRDRVIQAILELKSYVERGIIPHRLLDIKKLRGKWQGYMRLRVGKLRIIFKLNTDEETIYVYSIHHRKKAY